SWLASMPPGFGRFCHGRSMVGQPASSAPADKFSQCRPWVVRHDPYTDIILAGTWQAGNARFPGNSQTGTMPQAQLIIRIAGVTEASLTRVICDVETGTATLVRQTRAIADMRWRERLRLPRLLF